MVRNVSRECTEVTQMTLDEDFEKPSLWEQIYGNRIFCSPECSQRCTGDAEDNEVHDDWYPVRMNYDDEQPIASIPPISPDPSRKSMDVTGKLPTFSLPWAGLDGSRPNLGELSRQRNSDEAIEATQSLLPLQLPLSSRSTGSDFKALPKPRFLSGIPTKAAEYRPEASDPIDVELCRALQVLDPESSAILALYRVKSGRYEIDGRQVQLHWESNGSGRLLVCEDEVGGPSIADMPLQTYINLVANVAVDLQRPAAAGTSMTFYEPAAVILSKSTDGDRYRAMRIACTQARLRGEGAPT